MGKLLSKNEPHFKPSEGRTFIGTSQIQDTCPLCLQDFRLGTPFVDIQTHIDSCAKQEQKTTEPTTNTKAKEVFKPYVKLAGISRSSQGYTGKQLISPHYNIPFDKKLEFFRNNIKKLKVDWREGCCNLKLSRDFFLEESIQQFHSINIYKELKINFKGEVSHDAGGIIREWFTIVFKELQNEKRAIFEKQVDNNTLSYIVSPRIKESKFNREIFNFLGKLFAKAILENITINSCMNKIFFKILLNESIEFKDLVFIDKTLYNSLQEMKNCEDVLDDMEIYFMVNYEKDSVMVTEELIENGAFKKVTKDNINLFIEKKIEHLLKKDISFYNDFRSGFLSVINENLICIFNSDELELLINGQPFIDVEEWKEHTIYQGIYNRGHYVIKWFWEIIFKLEQDQMAKFLQFCTGTSRVPLGGFGVLESNRGEIAKFCIVPINFEIKQRTNYIKAHTCFNRIDLPLYPSKKLLEDAIKFIIQNEILGFGID